MILSPAGIFESTSKYPHKIEIDQRQVRDQVHPGGNNGSQPNDSKADKATGNTKANNAIGDSENMPPTEKTEEKPSSSEDRPKEGVSICFVLRH